MDQTAIYQVFAKALLVTCPEGFEEARIDAELESDWSQKSYHCKIDGQWSEGRAVSADIDFDVDDALHDLRNMMKQEGKQPWSRCTFTLKPNGEFNLDVSYPDDSPKA